MAKLIAFSGGCHSGKTTILNLVADKLENVGMNVVKFNELAREKISFNETLTDIDAIRRHCLSYYNLQKEIVNAKMEQEVTAIMDESDTIYLADRALTDSLFYFQNYTSPWKFNKYGKTGFYKLWNALTEHLDKYFDEYEYVFEFKPIQIGQDNSAFDLYRPNGTLTPKLMNAANQYEYYNIHMLNAHYNKGNVVELGTLDEKTCDTIVNLILL